MVLRLAAVGNVFMRPRCTMGVMALVCASSKQGLYPFESKHLILS